MLMPSKEATGQVSINQTSTLSGPFALNGYDVMRMMHIVKLLRNKSLYIDLKTPMAKNITQSSKIGV